MSNDCLLLNGNGKPVSYFPLSTINWKTAIRLLFTKNVIIIKNHESWRVRSPSMEVEVPSIIMLRRFHKFQNYVKFSRSNVYLRDMYRCQYCSNIFDTKHLTLITFNQNQKEVRLIGKILLLVAKLVIRLKAQKLWNQ